MCVYSVFVYLKHHYAVYNTCVSLFKVPQGTKLTDHARMLYYYIMYGNLYVYNDLTVIFMNGKKR